MNQYKCSCGCYCWNDDGICDFCRQEMGISEDYPDDYIDDDFFGELECDYYE